MAAPGILDPEGLRAELKDGSIAPVYLLAGPDGFRAERTARWLRERALDPATAAFNAETLYADERSPAAIAESASAYPMFGGRRVLWVRHAEQLPTGPAVEPLLRYLERPSESTLLLLTASKLDKRLKLTAACATSGRVVEFALLQGRALLAQVGRQAGEHGIRLAPGAAESLVDLVGEDLAELDAELAKLALHAGDREGAIEAAEVHELVARSRDLNAFALADRLDGRHPEVALDLWMELRGRGGDVMGAAAILGWRVRQLAQLRVALDEGLSPDEAGRRLGINAWQARRLLPLLEGFGSRGAARTLAAFVRADRRAKSSSLGAPLAYDLALLEWALASTT